MRVVQKYGGSSLATPARILNVAERIARAYREHGPLVVVLSAMGDTTDELLALAREVSPRPHPDALDLLLSTGEVVSIALMEMALRDRGVPAVALMGWQAGIRTTPSFGRALIESVESARLERHLSGGKVVLVAGFQGVTAEEEITTLGRGGSDTTAVALAAALRAERCEIYTDVDGVYTSDPRVVPKARKLTHVTYDEMLELAHLGAVVLHPRAVELAKRYGVPLYVATSLDDREGTWIGGEAQDMEGGRVVTGVAVDESVARVTLRGVRPPEGALKRLFGLLAEAEINVDIIITSAAGPDGLDVAFSLEAGDLERAIELLAARRSSLAYDRLDAEGGLAKVSVVGAGMASRPGVAAGVFRTLADAGIDVKMVSTSEIKISVVVEREQARRAARLLHTAFGLDDEAAEAGGTPSPQGERREA